jgi:hypothetical protein
VLAEKEGIVRLNALGDTISVQHVFELVTRLKLERKRQLFNELIEQNGPSPSLGVTEEEVCGLFDILARPRRLAA